MIQAKGTQVMIEVKGNTQPIKVTRNFPCRAKYEQKLVQMSNFSRKGQKINVKNDHFLLLCSSLWLTMGSQLHYIKQLQGIKRTTHPLKQNEINRKLAKRELKMSTKMIIFSPNRLQTGLFMHFFAILLNHPWSITTNLCAI